MEPPEEHSFFLSREVAERMGSPSKLFQRNRGILRSVSPVQNESLGAHPKDGAVNICEATSEGRGGLSRTREYLLFDHQSGQAENLRSKLSSVSQARQRS